MVNMNKYKKPAIYALHAGDNDYFYVGSTGQNSTTRLWEHVSRAHSGHKAPVYVRMRDIGIRNVEVVDLELITDIAQRATLEAAWIVRLIAEGHSLANQCGRDGVPNSMSADSKAILSKKKRGKPTWIKGKRGLEAGWTDERRKAQSEAVKARQGTAA